MVLDFGREESPLSTDSPQSDEEMQMQGLLQHNGSRDSLESLQSSQVHGSAGSSVLVFPVRRSYWRILMDGPPTPVFPKVTPVLPKLQMLPEVLKKHIPDHITHGFIAMYLVLWGLIFAVLANNSILATAKVDGAEADLLRCTVAPQVWLGKNEACGFNGEECYASAVGQEFQFKCPADCVKESWTYSETPVGDFESIYRPYVVGGNNSYRADSFICGAAIHRGVVSDSLGGCGVIRFTGPKASFASEVGHGGIESIGTDSEFPASYEFVDTSGRWFSKCRDLRIPIIVVNIVLSLVFGYLVGHAGLFFSVLLTSGFWTVILASNPPMAGGTVQEDAELVSLGFRRFLPCALSAYVIYAYSVHPQLDKMTAHLSRAVLWVPGFWIGILENYVFGHLPLDRLTAHDLNTQPGAWVALLSIVGIVLAIALGQAYVIWRMGKFKPYIVYFIIVGVLLVLLSMVPNQTLRMHHYIYTLILVPGTGVQTTPSLLYQGLLVGLFVSGIARWDFDSILQTYDQLRRGGPSLQGGMAEFAMPLVAEGANQLQNVVLKWKSLADTRAANVSVNAAFDGYSLIIDDVERYRGPSQSFNLTEWALTSLTDLAVLPVRYYVRVAFAKVSGGVTGDYTRAGVVSLASGEWTSPPPGAI